MDVPPPSDDEEEGGADLPLDASDEDIRAATTRKRPAPGTEEEREHENVVVAKLMKAVNEMRKIFKRHKAPLPPALHAESHSVRRARQRLVPTLDISVEMAAVSPVLRAMQVPAALRLGKALRAVRELLWSDDEMWMHWWFRDFPEMARDMGEEAGLPSWITENSWKRDLDHRIDSPKVVALARLPWRCWYQWSTFFRRSALHHIADIQNDIGRYYLDHEGHVEEEDEESISDEYRPSNVTTWGENVVLIVPPFDQDTGAAQGLVLVDDTQREDVYFPEEMFDTRHDLTVAPTAESAVVATAHSPVYWLQRYVDHILVWEEFNSKWDRMLSKRKIPKYLLLGGTSAMVGTGRLNFNYKNAMMLYCSWYTAALVRGGHAVPGFIQGFAPLRGEFSDVGHEYVEEFWGNKLKQILPAFPAVDGVWFVGERATPMVTDFVSAVACVGCHTTGDTPVRCKKCKKGYCGPECHKQNWHRSCAGCTKK